jgi:tocopherol cyclase
MAPISRRALLQSSVGALILSTSSVKAESSKNGYKLYGSLRQNGFDWWWHSFVARNRRTNEEQPFFIEYFVINPQAGGPEPILGQLEVNRKNGVRPSYAMLMAGTWKKNGAKQIHNYYGIDQFSASTDQMNVRIGKSFATEYRLEGSVSLSPELSQRPEYMSDAGEITWSLAVQKLLSFDVGFGASDVASELKAFEMYWHVQGMRSDYKGFITLDGEQFDVVAERSFGYQDKNWGTDFTNPWLWLNCNDFTSRLSGKSLNRTSFVAGGAGPVAFGADLPKHVLVACHYEGNFFEYNFSKPWTGSQDRFKVTRDSTHLHWDVTAWRPLSKVEARFSCPLSHMLKINYENPKGERNHRELWNGGHASGTLKIYKRDNIFQSYKLLDDLYGSFGGCEFGQY